ncbi:MAG: cob(I)yrinic acid a,c-diamide adenosyltransferase [Pseudomonadota bacterium]
MVKLNKIYTRTGDGGETHLGDGSRRPKDDLRVAAYGSVDEANACLGLVNTVTEGPIADLVQVIQNDLFDLGADLCRPYEEGSEALRITADHVLGLELAIDKFNENMPTLNSFVLPGGTPSASYLHLARTVVRRAERDIISLSHQETLNPHVIKYINRLSDLLFVLARCANLAGNGDILWEPAASISNDG